MPDRPVSTHVVTLSEGKHSGEMQRGWPLWRGVDCVECPRCSFTFDAFHTVASGEFYHCPLCGHSGVDEVERPKFRYFGRTRRMRLDRSWWRKASVLIAGCCHHWSHPQAECPATWQRDWTPPHFDGRPSDG